MRVLVTFALGSEFAPWKKKHEFSATRINGRVAFTGKVHGVIVMVALPEVVGVPLLAPSALRFRRKAAETGDRVSLAVEPCWPHRVGAQGSCARSASSFSCHTDACCDGAFW